MSALRPARFVGHEWEMDRRLHRGSLPDVINATDHLCGSVLGQTWNSLEWFPFGATGHPAGSITPNPGFGATGFVRGGCLHSRHYLSPPADQRTLVASGLSLVCSLTDRP